MTEYAQVTSFPPLYKRDTAGKVRVWHMDLGVNPDGSAAHRTVAGLQDGEKVTSTWKAVKGKNTGKVNATSHEEQARSEIESKYTKQRDKGHFDSLTNIDTFSMFKPMLAEKYEERGVQFGSVDVYAQPKLDGMRCLARPDGLWSRSFKEIVAVPHIFNALALVREKFPTIVIDGELYNHELKHDFEKLMSLCRKTKPTIFDLQETEEMVEYHIYDLYDSAEPNMPFARRYDFLHDIYLALKLAGFKCIKLVDTNRVVDAAELDALYDTQLEAGYEGQMIRYDLPYENKRSKTLLKRKEWMDEEFKVVAMKEGTGNWSGAAKNFEIVLESGETMTPAVKGSYEVLAALLKSGKTPNWAKVMFQGYTADGSLRFPRVVDYGYGERDD
jgi:DNA ligase-1